MPSLPFEIVDAMIQCFGRSFHWKDSVDSFFRTAGVPKTTIARYRNEPKFVWARHVLNDLSETEDGILVQRRILTELCKLRDLPDRDIADRDAGLNALRKLKELATENDLIAKQVRADGTATRRQAEERARLVEERAKKLDALKQSFFAAVVAPDRQDAGYTLENLLKDLFALFEIEYTKPYKTPTQQIDGHFRFDGFDYLVEAKWRKDQPTEGEILLFKGKVDGKFESTRGLFVAVQGVRDDVCQAIGVRGNNIILMDGEDLTLILEGRLDWRDALRFKITKAAQAGHAFARLRDYR